MTELCCRFSRPSRSAKCSAPATGCWPRCTTRPPNRAATSAADHPTATARRRRPPPQLRRRPLEPTPPAPRPRFPNRTPRRLDVRQRLAGHSIASIARHLNERGIPCPSSADPDRNRHRTRSAWTLRTVAVILANPRYTGRQTWNRRATGTEGPASTPALSAKAAHPALITEQDFVAAQQVRATRPADDGQTRRFALAGLIHCGVCDRRLDSHWNHGRPTYRCRHGHTSTQRASQERAKTLYIREDHLVDEISIQLGDQGHDGHSTPELDRPRHRRVAAALRDSGKIIIYDGAGWRLQEIDSS
ncbi:recombinase family protein [Amycolatopsis sp. NPDC051128]|uniref:recombinase family protein n=1 Tax=Amycolatopsis sp. NPDC051128 TaxID=3155412 RepID=UPI003428FC40